MVDRVPALLRDAIFTPLVRNERRLPDDTRRELGALRQEDLGAHPLTRLKGSRPVGKETVRASVWSSMRWLMHALHVLGALVLLWRLRRLDCNEDRSYLLDTPVYWPCSEVRDTARAMIGESYSRASGRPPTFDVDSDDLIVTAWTHGERERGSRWRAQLTRLGPRACLVDLDHQTRDPAYRGPGWTMSDVLRDTWLKRALLDRIEPWKLREMDRCF